MDTFLKIYVPVFMVTYFSTALFFKSYLLYKKTGINPVTFGRKSDSAHDYIGSWFKVMLCLIFIHGLLYPFIRPVEIGVLENDIYKLAGVILTAASLLFTLYSQQAMAESWRIGIDESVKTRLVTSGPFKYTKNPIFLAMLATLAGLFLIMPTYFMGVLFILSYLLINVQVRLEEEHLEKIHGEEYTEYKKRVGRFLPTRVLK